MSILVPTVTVELDKTRTMRLDFNALIAFKRRTGINLIGGQYDGTDPELQVVLIWALLRGDDPTLTEEQLGGMLHLGNIAGLAAKATELMTRAIRGEDADEAPVSAGEASEGEAPLEVAA